MDENKGTGVTDHESDFDADIAEAAAGNQAARRANATLAASSDSSAIRKPQLPIAPVLGIIVLTSASSIYLAYGVASYPRQEWLLESLASILFIIPVLNLLVTPGSFAKAVRVLGLMLILHSVWDALHWPGQTLIETPIDPWVPRVCPVVDVIVGTWLLVRGR